MESEKCIKSVSAKKKTKSTKLVMKDIKTPRTSNKIKKHPTFEDIEHKIFEKANYSEKLKHKDISKNILSNSSSNIKRKVSLISHRVEKYDPKEANNLESLRRQSCSLLASEAKLKKHKSNFKAEIKSKNDVLLPSKCKGSKVTKPSKLTSKLNGVYLEDKIKIEKNYNEKSVENINSNKTASKSKKSKLSNIKANNCEKYRCSSDSDDSDFENEDELIELLNNKESSSKSETIQIELKQENLLWGYKKRKKRTEQNMIEDYLRKQCNKVIREVYENMHKCHLLCLFAHGKYVNTVITSQSLLATSMSLIPKDYFSPKRFDLSHLEKFVKWFCKIIDLKQKNYDDDYSSLSLEDILSHRLSTKSVNSNKEMVLLFTLIARSIGMDVRLVFSFYPISWKPSIDCLIKPIKDEIDDTVDLKAVMPFVSFEATSSITKTNHKKKYSHKMIASDTDDKILHQKKSKRKKIKSIKKIEASDSEFELENKNIKIAKKVSISNDKHGKKRKSFDDNNPIKKVKREILTEWAEVYIEEEEKWICVDVTKCKIHCASDIENQSSSNIAYVVAYHADHTVKDVTRRYVSSWLSYKEKIRCDGKWWEATLKPFLGSKTRKDKEEDRELDENLRMQPLPKTLGEYKNHPLYALQRHLLKFEAIYPPNPSPAGFFKGEPVYPRECVKTLSGREYWIREAKVVKVGEDPYKVVKARPKWDKGLSQLLKDRPLELFGEWQVEDYEPPIAKNGKVPRNEYGNVELFKPSMLPKGCIYMPIGGLGRIARKLDIDCAPALVGFEFHKGGCHPINDGFVICEEFKDIILDAWNQEKAEQVKREKEKKLKLIYNNWKRLIHGITLKKRIKETYGNADKEVKNSTDAGEEPPKTIKETKKGQTLMKIQKNNLAASVSNIITHPVVNLQIDFNSCISSMAREKRQMNNKSTRGNKVLNKEGNLGRNNMDAIKRSDGNGSILPVSDDSDDNINVLEKQEKIRKILDWNPEQGFGRSNPNLSDDSDKVASDFETPDITSKYVSSPWSAKVTKKGKIMKRKMIRKKMKNNSEKDCPASESSSASDYEEEIGKTADPTKRLSLRSLKQDKKVTYNEGEASDISFNDSDVDDKTFVPVKKKPTKSLLDLSDESD